MKLLDITSISVPKLDRNPYNRLILSFYENSKDKACFYSEDFIYHNINLTTFFETFFLKILVFCIRSVVQFRQISFVMSLVRAGLLLSLIMMLCSASAMIPAFTPAFGERISEVLMVSHHRNHGRFKSIQGRYW